MTSDMSIVSLLLDASLPVQLVMILLILASLVSWSIIFTKRRLIRRTKDASDDFETSFWSGGDLNTLYRSASRESGGSIGMASIIEARFFDWTHGRIRKRALLTMRWRFFLRWSWFQPIWRSRGAVCHAAAYLFIVRQQVVEDRDDGIADIPVLA